MSDDIDLFEPEGFIPSDLRPPNFNFRSRKTKLVEPCFPKPFKQAIKKASEAAEPNWPKKPPNWKITLVSIPTTFQRDSGDGKD